MSLNVALKASPVYSNPFNLALDLALETHWKAYLHQHVGRVALECTGEFRVNPYVMVSHHREKLNIFPGTNKDQWVPPSVGLF